MMIAGIIFSLLLIVLGVGFGVVSLAMMTVALEPRVFRLPLFLCGTSVLVGVLLLLNYLVLWTITPASPPAEPVNLERALA